MPVRDDDWYMPISLVSFADLIPKPEGSTSGKAETPRGETRSQRKERFLFDGSYDYSGADAAEREAIEADFSPWDDAEPSEA